MHTRLCFTKQLVEIAARPRGTNGAESARMLRHLLGVALVLVANPARADDSDTCDFDCQIQIDECADPAAGCLDERDPDDAMLEAADMATTEDECVDDSDPACADPPENGAGAEAAPADDAGCSSGRATGIAVAAAALALLAIARKRRALLALTLVACALDGGDSEPALDDAEVLAAPAPCAVSIHSATHSPLVFMYASPGSDETLRFLHGCPGEVVVGEKREGGPVGSMKTVEAHVAGGRTAFVLDRHGDKLRALLLRDNGLERTVAYLENKLAHGYDYIAIDEITAAGDFRDGTTLNRRLRRLVQRMPARTIIPYISIDLVQHAGGFQAMQARKLLLRTFKLRARALALEVYLHTPEAIGGAAPSAFALAADRLALSVAGLPRGGGINLRAITVIGTSMHSTFPQYRYLDQPARDLRSLTLQVDAIVHGTKRLKQQNGVGYYFVNKSDMAPLAGAPYSYDGLIRRMRLQALRFR